MHFIEAPLMQTASAKSVNAFGTNGAATRSRNAHAHRNAQQTKLLTVLSKKNIYVNVDACVIIHLHYLQDMVVGIRHGLKECYKTVTN